MKEKKLTSIKSHVIDSDIIWFRLMKFEIGSEKEIEIVFVAYHRLFNASSILLIY